MTVTTGTRCNNTFIFHFNHFNYRTFISQFLYLAPLFLSFFFYFHYFCNV